MGIRTEFLKSEIFSVMDSVRASAPNLKVVFQRLRGDPSLTNKSRREIPGSGSTVVVWRIISHKGQSWICEVDLKENVHE